jgi:signal transduction histidine kinase/ActR/RegA family two-component response regulator
MNVTNTETELRARLRQQEILATLGALALKGGSLDTLFQETTRMVAQGLNTSFCKVLEAIPPDGRLLVRSGVGWHEGVVGHAVIGGDTDSPAGFALQTGQPVISNTLSAETRFRTPKLLLDHGIQRAINVIIRNGTNHYGVLEADSANPGSFENDDVAFMQAAANLLGIAVGRKHVENELEHSHARISEVLDSISDAFYAMDHEWRFVYFNRNAEVLWRRRRGDILGKTYIDEFAEALGPAIHAAHLRAAQERRPVNVEALSPALDRWLDVAVFPSADGLSVYMRDITQRKETEAALQAFTRTLEDRVADRTRELAESNERLVDEMAERQRAEAALMQAQRLEAIGQLTGGIAHDFNNLLTAVIGNLELLQRSQTDARARRMADAALYAARRGGVLTSQLLAYARKQHIEPRALDLSAVILGMREMLERTLGGVITIEMDCRPSHWLAMADPVQIEAVVLNLAINARDAMTDGGMLRIATQEMPEASDRLPEELQSGDYVMISVADDGEGMPPDVAAHAFEPFFTTKEIGKGSGLGLAQVHGIAMQFGGTARLRSTVGVGTTVEVFLPRAEIAAEIGAESGAEPRVGSAAGVGPATEAVAAETGARDDPADATTAHGDGVPVLVVDDQEDVRAVTATFLEEAGYQVLQAGSGMEALAALRTAPQVVLALVDHGMAGMSGREFVRAARSDCPRLDVVYITGNAQPLDEAGIDAGDTVLTKPYDRADLLKAVGRMVRARVSD